MQALATYVPTFALLLGSQAPGRLARFDGSLHLLDPLLGHQAAHGCWVGGEGGWVGAHGPWVASWFFHIMSGWKLANSRAHRGVGVGSSHLESLAHGSCAKGNTAPIASSQKAMWTVAELGVHEAWYTAVD